MTKTFADKLAGLSPEQFDAVQAQLTAERNRRGVTAEEFARVGQMTENEFEAFRNRAYQSAPALNAVKESEANDDPAA